MSDLRIHDPTIHFYTKYCVWWKLHNASIEGINCFLYYIRNKLEKHQNIEKDERFFKDAIQICEKLLQKKVK